MGIMVRVLSAGGGLGLGLGLGWGECTASAYGERTGQTERRWEALGGARRRVERRPGAEVCVSVS
jgi:hypothetical protein